MKQQRQPAKRTPAQDPRIRLVARPGTAEPEHRTIIALDIEGFGRPERTNLIRLRLRRRLRQLCTTLLQQIGATEDQYVTQDTGDGFILSISGVIPKTRLLGAMVPRLAGRLAVSNRRLPENERMRLRVALHAGDVLSDPEPLYGEAVIFAARLLDADALRTCLGATRAPLALIVSPTIYNEIVKHGYGRIQPASYLPTFVASKETRTKAWVHVPGDLEAPERSGIVARKRSVVEAIPTIGHGLTDRPGA